MQEFKKTPLATEKSSKKVKVLENLGPLVDKPFSSGRPAMSIEKILEDFKKEFISKENLLSNPTLLAFNVLDRKYKNLKGHFFHSLRNLHKRVYGLQAGWYTPKGPLAYVLVKLGWFTEKEVGPFLEKAKKEFSLQIKKHLSEKAINRMKIINNRLKIRETLKNHWKKESYRQRMLNLIQEKKRKLLFIC